jgi:radical SAM-linked protein
VHLTVGHAGETDEDLAEAVQVLRAARAVKPPQGSPPRLSLTLHPAPRNGFESCGEPAEAAYRNGAARVRDPLQGRRIKTSTRSFRQLCALASLSTGRLPVEALSRLAAQITASQADPESFDEGVWLDAMTSARVDPDCSLRDRIVDPAADGAVDTSFERLLAENRPAGFGPPPWHAGRRPRRTSRGRAARQADRYRVRFSKSEPLRFTAHLDVTRAFDRAFRRTQLPVAMSQGKDRKPKLAYGPPLPLGMTSGGEYFDVTFSREVPESFARSLDEALPEGLTVVAAAPVRTEPASLNSAIQIADYEISFPDVLIQGDLGSPSFDTLKDRLDQAVAGALAADTIDVTRTRGEVSRTYNARPSLLGAKVVRDDGGRPLLGLTLTLNHPDSARPETLTRALCDWADFDERLLRIHRSGLAIPGRDSSLDPLDVVAPGFAWWQHPVRGGTVL